MLTTHDVGALFRSMRVSYGPLWKHGKEAMPIWEDALRKCQRDDVRQAANKAIRVHVEYPPTLPQFLQLVRESTPKLDSPVHDNLALAERVFAYTMPEGKSNPGGNPHRIRLPDSIAQRKVGESPADYENRISTEMTFAMYPKMRSQFLV